MATAMSFGTDQDYDGGFELPANGSNNHYQVTPTGAEPIAEDRWGSDFSDEETRDALTEDLPPEGTYEGQGLVATREHNKFEGYPQTRFVGQVRNPQGRTAYTSFTITREKHRKPDGKLVWAYVMFKQCFAAFAQAHGRNPQNGQELEDYISTASLVHELVRDKRSGRYLNTMSIKAATAAAPVDDIPF